MVPCVVNGPLAAAYIQTDLPGGSTRRGQSIVSPRSFCPRTDTLVVSKTEVATAAEHDGAMKIGSSDSQLRTSRVPGQFSRANVKPDNLAQSELFDKLSKLSGAPFLCLTTLVRTVR